MTDTPQWKQAFPGFSDPQRALSIWRGDGPLYCPGMSDDIAKAPAVKIGTAEDVAGGGYHSGLHQGYYADEFGHETYYCNVYKYENDVICPECNGEAEQACEENHVGYCYACDSCFDADPDKPFAFYFAVIESSDSDCAWLDPETHESAMDAARASDSLAESLAETERAYNETWNAGGAAYRALKEANDMRREAIKFERQARAHEAELRAIHAGRVSLFAMRWIYPAAWRTIETMRREASRLWECAQDDRTNAFAKIEERPECHLVFGDGATHANWYEAWKAGHIDAYSAWRASLVDAWREGWQT